MARTGDQIENPITGELIVFRKTSADTRGELLELDLTVRPHTPLLMEHMHAKQAERFEMISGELSFKIDGRTHSAREGDVVVIAPMTRHQWWNSGDETAHANLSLSPALDFETVLETMFGLARDGKANARGIPNLLQVAVLARFSDGYLPGPPIAVQRIAFRILAFIGRLFGYRARYDRYSGGSIQGKVVDRR